MHRLSAQQAGFHHEISVQSDNDVYLLVGQDRYYTNGININYRVALPPKVGKTISATVLELEVGQRIYNGTSIWQRGLEQMDRPFAGYLYGSMGVRFYLPEDQVFFGKVEVGQIGPKAGGEEAQKFIHHLFGMYEVSGWDDQLDNALGIDVQATYLKQFWQNNKGSFDIGGAVVATLGTNNTNLGVRFPLRVGRLASYRYSVFTKGSLTASPSERGRECYFLYEPALSHIFYNSTLEGGYHRNDEVGAMYEKNRWINSHKIGFHWANSRINYGINYIFNSKEVKSALHRHQYGELFLGVRF